MLSIVAFASLAVGLVLLFIIARKARGFWAAVFLIVGAAALFAVHLRTLDGRRKRIDDEIAESCRSLASDLKSDADRYRMMTSADPYSWLQLREQWLAAYNARYRWVRMCVPAQRADHCLPVGLSERTLGKIDRAAAAIGARTSCDTGDVE